MTVHLPLYIRVADALRAELLAGDWDAERRVPSEREVQRRHGVSRPTASKALAALAAEGLITRAQGRVSEIAAQHGSAVRPVNGSQHVIGLVAPISDNPLVQHVLRGADREAGRRGVRLLMATTGQRPERERDAILGLIEAGVQGVLVYPVARPISCDRHDELQAQFAVPLVLVDMCGPCLPHDQVVFDNYRAGYAQTSRLLADGRRRIGFCVWSVGDAAPTLEDRLHGYRDALADAGVPFCEDLILHYDGQGGFGAAARSVLDLLGRVPGVDGLIASEDTSAMEIIDGLLDVGIRVHEDVAVVGFDNRVEARRFHVPFSTTQPDFERMGEIACRILLGRIAGGDPVLRTYVLPVPVLVRRGRSPHAGAYDSGTATDP